LSGFGQAGERQAVSMKQIGVAAPLWATILMAASALSAQVPAIGDVAPAFEVASVKPSEGSDTGWAFDSRAGRFTATNVPLQNIIALAYRIPTQVQRFRIVGGEDLLSRRFDIQATLPEELPSERISLMVKSLLIERFGLRAHSEVRQGPVYALIVARRGALGPELRTSKHNCNQYRTAWRENHTPASEVVRPRDAKNRPLCQTRPDDERPPAGSQRMRDAGTISELIDGIQMLERPVIDATGLSGNFEWQLTFSPGAIPTQDSDVLSLPAALHEQLGLKLEQRTGPIDVLVIDDVRMPTPN
jgi:uncharacterized protein (TIGR03435 family)